MRMLLPHHEKRWRVDERMRFPLLIAFLAALLMLPGCASSKKQVLSDSEMDQIHAGSGEYKCDLFGRDGPCVGSFSQIFDPALPANPRDPCGGPLAGTNKNCVSFQTVSPLVPRFGSVSVNQSVTVTGPFSFQRISQTNSVGTTQPASLSCPVCSRALDRLLLPGW